MNKYRTLQGRLNEALDVFRVVSVTGPRQAGKTTLVREIAAERGLAYASLEDASLRAAAGTDADAWLDALGPRAAIDEVQHVPDLFRAIKRKVDASNEPGQYLITGSALWLSMPAIGETLAGRVALLNLWPFSYAERESRTPFDLNLLCETQWDHQAVQRHAENPEPSGGKTAWLEDAMLRGGYPEPGALKRPPMRKLWFDSYVSTYLQRDVLDITRIEHPDAYQRLIRLLCARTGQLLNGAALARDLGVPQPTIKRYVDWLTLTYQRFDVLPFSANTGKRLVRTPKSYWSDTGMVAALMGWMSWPEVARTGTDGALLETWVAGELRKALDAAGLGPLYFWRTHGGAEVDFLIEYQGRVTAIEVKLGHRVDARDLKGLKECADALGNRFLRGIVVYGGYEVLPLGHNLYAVPLSFLRGTKE
ncbi:MAG: ATP-binding protein [Spartobacteria bacterium]|nr:ATP-binding protein [Spartobacteria bacterium]